MRNVFDQYDQPENKLTHAFVTTLERERALLRPFLRWLGLRDLPPTKTLKICEQQVPGSPQSDLDKEEAQGLPDACVFNADGWMVLIECKVQARVSPQQIRRHRKTAIRYGFESPHVVVIAVDESDIALQDETKAIMWKDVYCWFSKRASDSV